MCSKFEQNLKPITHIIFDLDGTLVNSVDVLIEVLRNYAKTYGIQVSPEIERYLPNLENIPLFFQKFRDSIENHEIPDSAVLSKIICNQVFKSNFDLNKGVDKVVKHLSQHNYPMAIATAVPLSISTKYINKFGNYFEPGINFSHIVFGGDDPEVVHNKPHPEIYTVCVKRFQTQPKSLNNVLIIEDSVTGIKGALDSGMRTLMVKDKRIRESDITFDTEITPVINSFDDFIPQDYGLPVFEYIHSKYLL